MFARVTRFNIRPESLQQGHRQIEEHLIPALRMQKGYSGTCSWQIKRTAKC
jgi:hypothetical protein